MGDAFVTIMFTDLVGSASLFERHGDDAADSVRREHFDLLRRALAEHDGREVKSTDAGLMVAFASAVSAVRCAVEMQRATAAAEGRLELRVGLDAGEQLPEGEDLYGTPVSVACRPPRSTGGRQRARPQRYRSNPRQRARSASWCPTTSSSCVRVSA